MIILVVFQISPLNLYFCTVERLNTETSSRHYARCPPPLRKNRFCPLTTFAFLSRSNHYVEPVEQKIILSLTSFYFIMKVFFVAQFKKLVLVIMQGGRCSYGSFFRSLLSPNFLILLFKKVEIRRQRRTLSLLQIDSVPSATFAFFLALIMILSLDCLSI
jgi:hypothetical protein